MWGLSCLPAGESLATASVDTLGQGVIQSGINHIETDRLLVHLTARVPAQQQHNHIKAQQLKIQEAVHIIGQSSNNIHPNPIIINRNTVILT